MFTCCRLATDFGSAFGNSCMHYIERVKSSWILITQAEYQLGRSRKWNLIGWEETLLRQPGSGLLVMKTIRSACCGRSLNHCVRAHAHTPLCAKYKNKSKKDTKKMCKIYLYIPERTLMFCWCVSLKIYNIYVDYFCTLYTICITLNQQVLIYYTYIMFLYYCTCHRLYWPYFQCEKKKHVLYKLSKHDWSWFIPLCIHQKFIYISCLNTQISHNIKTRLSGDVNNTDQLITVAPLKRVGFIRQQVKSRFSKPILRDLGKWANVRVWATLTKAILWWLGLSVTKTAGVCTQVCSVLLVCSG